jgi:chemotaxis protein MotB
VFFTFTAEEASLLEKIKDTLTTEVEGLNQENEKLKEEKESLAALLFGSENSIDSSESFMKFLEKNNLKESVYIIEEERGLVIRFKDGVLFSSGKATISESGYNLLNEIAEKIQGIPNLVVIEGFTDNIPIKTNDFPSNWELSVARAIGVAKFMIDDMDIGEERISVSGFGEQRPIDTNDTEEGRANNRRIEITILD